MKLSIIVPVYNVEKYVIRCLDSFYTQDLNEDDFEVIVVNDGSTDNSLEIVETFSEKHHNVKVISQINGGLSATRNTGIENARGEYVWFVDSDDFIEPNSVKLLLEYAVNNNLDVLCFNLQLYFEGGKITSCPNPSTIQHDITDGTNFIITQWMPPAACLALYKKKYLLDNNLHFFTGILHEDQEFTPRAYYLAKRISYKDIVVYNYYQRDGSIMKSNNKDKRVISFISICDSLYDFCNKHAKKGSPQYLYFMKNIVFAYSQALYFWDSESSLTLKEIKTKPYYPLRKLKGMTTKEKLKINLINFSCRLYNFVANLK